MVVKGSYRPFFIGQPINIFRSNQYFDWSWSQGSEEETYNNETLALPFILTVTYPDN